jgi:Ca2+-binding EF-hand superfamily protein
MGSCTSVVYDEKPGLLPWKGQFTALNLSHSDVAKFHTIFLLVDKNKRGFIDLNEFMNHLKIESTNFRKRAFAMFDEGSSGQVDFREFVLSIWNCCTLSRSSLGMNIFSN